MIQKIAIIVLIILCLVLVSYVRKKENENAALAQEGREYAAKIKLQEVELQQKIEHYENDIRQLRQELEKCENP